MKIPEIEIGDLPPCPVAEDALQGIPRQQTNASRWQGDTWSEFVAELEVAHIDVTQTSATNSDQVSPCQREALVC